MKNDQEIDTERIANFFLEAFSLLKLKRSHYQVIPATDSVAEHSFLTAIIGMILASLEKVDEAKVIKMCLLHDLAEARTGDLNFLNQLYACASEKEARQDQLKGLPIEQEALNLLEEFETRETKEAKIAKDADNLCQILFEQIFLAKDPKNRKIWQENKLARLYTETAKKIAKTIRASDPLEWLYRAMEDKRGKKIER